MHSRLATLLLASSAVTLSYLVLLARTCAFHLARSVALELHYKTIDEAMLRPTRFAVDYAWVFVLLIAFVSGVAMWLVARQPTRALRFLVLGVSAEGLVVWAAMVCFCYEPFLCDLPHLYRGPELDSGSFLTALGGMFPMTLGVLLATFFAAIIEVKKSDDRS